MLRTRTAIVVCDGEGRVNGGGRRDDIEHPRSCYQGTVEGGMTC